MPEANENPGTMTHAALAPGPGPTLTTERLLLRRWRETDLEPFAKLNADPEVMAWFPHALTPQESAAVVERYEAHFERRGFGRWALERRSDGRFLGCTGIVGADFPAPFTPAIEIGWRLARPYWGRGYATEGALAAIDFGFGTVGVDEIVAFTPTGNSRSRALMSRLGFRRDPTSDFKDTRLRPDDPLAANVLYRLRRPPIEGLHQSQSDAAHTSSHAMYVK